MQNSRGIVLRTVKYGETSLIVTIFTEIYGIQAFMMQGIRRSKKSGNAAGLLQPAILLEIVMHYQPLKSLQRAREFQPAYLYRSIQQDVIKNAVALFSIELLLRLLPEHAPIPDLFEFAYNYFIELDKVERQQAGNYPLYFIIMCSRHMGFEPKGGYSPGTPYLNLQEGGYTAHPPPAVPFMTDTEGAALHQLLRAESYPALQQISINSGCRFRLLQWYIAFLQAHSQHMGNIRSLSVMQAILH